MPDTTFFDRTKPIAFEGEESRSPLAFRWYDKDRQVMGKRMEDHLRFAVCYWHSFTWPGGDPFGGETFMRPWMHGGDPLELAKQKADVAFEMFRLLDVPFFTFHDVDVAPEGATLAEFERQPQGDHRHLRGEDGERQGPAPVGHRQPLLATAATWPARRPIPIRTSSPMPADR